MEQNKITKKNEIKKDKKERNRERQAKQHNTTHGAVKIECYKLNGQINYE